MDNKIFQKENVKKFIVIFVLLVLALVALNKALRSSHDFHTFHRTAVRLVEGNYKIYDRADGTVPFWYPPFFAYLFYPFGFLSEKVAQVLWGFINLFFLWGLFFELQKVFLKRKEKRYGFWGLVLLSIFYPLFSNFWAGNVHVFLLYLFVLSFGKLLNKKFFQSSFFLTLAIFIKITPIIIVPYYLYKRQWKIVLYIIPISLAFIFLPGFFIGHEKNLVLYKTLVSFLGYFDAQVDMARIEIQSIMGMSLRFFSTPVSDYAVNFLSFKRETTMLLGKILSLLSVLPIALIFIKNYFRNFEKKDELEFAILIASLVFLTPSSWLHTYVFLLPLFVLGIDYFYTLPIKQKELYLWIFAWALIALSPDFFWGKKINNYMEALSLPMFGGFLLCYLGAYLYLKLSKQNSVLSTNE